MCRDCRPASIDDLWKRQQMSSTMCAEHYLAEHLDLWASSDEISDLLSDNDRLQNLVIKLYGSSMYIGQFCEAHSLSDNPQVLVVASCDKCNTPYDAGNCEHPSSPPRAAFMDPQVSLHVHLTVVTLSIISQLLTKSNADKLVLLLAREMPSKCAVSHEKKMKWIQKCHNSLKPNVLPALVALIDNCSNAFPKAGQLGAGVMSLIICQRPAVALAMLEPDHFVTSAIQYLKKVFFLVPHNSECSIEQYFGVVAFLNILPALYHLGNWTAQHERLEKSLVALVTTIIINICHSITDVLDGRVQNEAFADQAPDLEECPELLSAKILMEPLMYRDGDTTQASATDEKWRARVLKERPMSFAVAAGLEILAWWATHGVDLSKGSIPTDGSGPISALEALAEYQDRIGQLAKRVPRLGFINKITDELSKGRKPPLPTREESLLYGPLIYANRRCGLASCRKLEGVRGGELMRCSGGCGGLEHYCCKEHQKEHWGVHKVFCKTNKVAAQL
jgi:hypothetical protein